MILEQFPDGRYRWACDHCTRQFCEQPHRGPRRSLCSTCKNVSAYRKKNPVVIRITAATRRAGLGKPPPPPQRR